jgi:hypothetical protein
MAVEITLQEMIIEKIIVETTIEEIMVEETMIVDGTIDGTMIAEIATTDVIAMTGAIVMIDEITITEEITTQGKALMIDEIMVEEVENMIEGTEAVLIGVLHGTIFVVATVVIMITLITIIAVTIAGIIIAVTIAVEMTTASIDKRLTIPWEAMVASGRSYLGQRNKNRCKGRQDKKI